MSKKISEKYDLIDKKLIIDLKTNKTSLGENPFIPMDAEEGKFLSKLFFNRYKTLYNKCVSVNDSPNQKLTQQETLIVSQQTVQQAMLFEEPYREELLRLAYNIVEDLFDIELGKHIQINAELGYEETLNKIDTTNLRFKPDQQTTIKQNSYKDIQNLKKEIHKRRLVNALIQGASNSFNSVFYMYQEELNSIDPRLYPLYEKMIPNSEIFYYFMKIEDGTPIVPGGICDVDTDSEIPTINSASFVFPILIHEIIKGMFELLSLHGLPTDLEEREYVLKKADYVYAEGWDMLLGIPLWRNIVELMPTSAVNDKHQLFFELIKQPVDKFEENMLEVLAKTPTGEEIIKIICEKIEREKSQDEMSQILDDLNAEDDDFL